MAGFKYEKSPKTERELCDISSIKRMSGGVALKKDTRIDADYMIPQLAPLSVVINGKKREAELAIRVKVLETPSDKNVKVGKGAPLSAGMYLCDGENTLTVSSVKRDNPDYDVITAEAAATSFAKDAILFEATDASGKQAKAVATNLNYAWQSLSDALGNGVTPIYRAFEVRESKLYIPLTDDDKKSLRENGVFVFTY